MEETVFLALIDKYLKGNASSAEQRLVEEYCKRLEDNGRELLSYEQEQALKEVMMSNIRKDMRQSALTGEAGKTSGIYHWIGYAAASILIVFSAALYFNTEKPVESQLAEERTKVTADDVGPGGDKAILTLADGSRIILDDAKNGTIAQQAGINITKSEDGRLVYNISSHGLIKNPELLYNKIETPKGGQYQVNLPDGSKVWLNAASSLRYPAIFQGDERKVKLTGEAYFEVAPDKSMPFRIETGNQVVEVLGTHFNINGYNDESDIKTTLIEGSVKVADISKQKAEFLKPGQVAVTAKNGNISIENTNTDQAISWKNGTFIFNDMELESIMRQLERWYDINVDYSKIPKTRYNAHISRDLNLSEVLETLEITGRVKFKIEGKTIKIINN